MPLLMGLSRFFRVLVRKNVLLSQLPLQSQWHCRNKNILPAFLSNQIPIFGSRRGVSYHRALLSNEARIDPRLEFVAEQIEQFQTEDIKQQKLDTRKTEQQEAVEEVIAGVNLEKDNTVFQHELPEWTAFMEYLVSNDYFESFVDDDEISNIVKDFNHVRGACLKFGRARFDILRSLSKEDIRAVVNHGCPNTDKKVVNSGKHLRSYVNIEEGEVCSKCNLRDSCDRAYLNVSNVEGANTVHLMRILLAYSIDPKMNSTEAKLQMKKTVRASVCKVLKDVVELAATPIDPNLPQPVSKQPAQKKIQASPPQKEWLCFPDIEMKAGDWHCAECNVINFARNSVCIKCNEKRPKTSVRSGDWECPDCSFFNFQRNMKCHKCDCDRPKDSAEKLNPGDWECPKCNFLNFRRNTTCLECDHKHPKIDQREIAKQLNPSDWKCPKCSFLNFRRNMTCIKCDGKHPGDDNTELARQLNSEDWKCPECSFWNFRRNMTCIKCDGKYSGDNNTELARQLNSGDWKCPECSYLNFRRNMTCIKCDGKHPGDNKNSRDWKCPECSFLNFRRNMTCIKCDGKYPGDNNTELARQLNSGDWKCPECNFFNFGGNMRCLKCGFRHLKDKDKEYDFHAKTNGNMLNNPRRRKSAGLGGDDYNFDDFPVRGGKSEIASGRTLGEHGIENISQFGSGINRSSSVEVTSNDFLDLHLSDVDEDESDNDNDVDCKQKRVDSGRSSSTSARKGGRASNNFNSDGFLVLGGSGNVGLRKLEKNGNKAFSQQISKEDKLSSLGDDPNNISDLDDDNDVGYKLKSADGKRSSDRSGRFSTSFKGKGKGYNYDDTDDDDDSLFDCDIGKSIGLSERPLSSKTKSVKRSYENFGDFDEDDDELSQSEDEQPLVSRTKQKGNNRSLPSKSKSVKKSFDYFGDSDEGEDDDLCESEDEQPQVSRTKHKGDKRSFGG